MFETKILILEKERGRRFFYLVGVGILLLIYFYRFLYFGFVMLIVTFSPRYAEVNGNSAAIMPPSLDIIDSIVLLAALAVLLLVVFKPRNYIRKIQSAGSTSFHVFQTGQENAEYSAIGPTALNIKRTFTTQRSYNRASRSWTRSSRVNHVIHTVSDPEVVIYNRPDNGWTNLPRFVEKVERFFGDITWVDNEGIINQRQSPNRVIAEQKRLKKSELVEQRLSKSERRAPEVQNLWGVRIIMILVLTGFGAAFWFLGEYRSVGGVFWFLSLIIFIDMLLTFLGVGQQPEKKKK